MGAHDHSKGREVNAQYLRVRKVIIHPHYNIDGLVKADLALLQLDKPAQMNSRVTLACLPRYRDQVKVGNQNCFIAGLLITSSYLQYVSCEGQMNQ